MEPQIIQFPTQQIVEAMKLRHKADMARHRQRAQEEMDTQGMMQGLGNQTASVGCIACEMVYENRKSWGATSGMCLDCYMKRNYGATRAEAPKRKEEPEPANTIDKDGWLYPAMFAIWFFVVAAAGLFVMSGFIKSDTVFWVAIIAGIVSASTAIHFFVVAAKHVMENSNPNNRYQ